MSLLDRAIDIVNRGWAVFPCLPRSKAPATKNGLNAATKDVEQVRRWWDENPAYNPAINLGASNLTVLDVDTGLGTREKAQDFCERFPRTFTLRTGRRPEWGVQLYFTGTAPNRPYELEGGISGEVRSTGYYVMAPGAIHDKSGETYVILRDLLPAPIPPLILSLVEKKIPKPIAASEEKVGPSFRHYYLTARAVELFASELSGEGLINALKWLNHNRCSPPKNIPGEIEGIARWAEASITPGLFKEDTQLVARLIVEDAKWKAAWEGKVDEFSDVAEAFEYLIARLFAQGQHLKPWAIERICKASPLHKLIE